MKTNLALVVTVLLSLGACNTIEGLGEDMRAAGSAVGDAVN